MHLAVGEMVVYGPHGLGCVVARVKGRVRGAEQELVVLEFDDGLTVSLPIERAREQLRALASEAEIGRVRKTLREEHAVSNEPWLTRRRDAQAKLTGGNPVGLAEILRDSAARERSLVARGGKSQLGPGERELFVKARRRLSREIGHIRGLGVTEADSWIDLQLARP